MRSSGGNASITASQLDAILCSLIFDSASISWVSFRTQITSLTVEKEGRKLFSSHGHKWVFTHFKATEHLFYVDETATSSLRTRIMQGCGRESGQSQLVLQPPSFTMDEVRTELRRLIMMNKVAAQWCSG